MMQIVSSKRLLVDELYLHFFTLQKIEYRGEKSEEMDQYLGGLIQRTLGSDTFKLARP